MKFARICFLENGSKKGLLDKMPQFLRRIYYTRIYKNKFGDIRLFSADGILVGIPFARNEENFELLNKYVEKTVKQLREIDVYSICAEKGISLPCGTKIADGKGLLCAMGEAIFKNACTERNITPEEADIAVIDGGDDNIKVLISSIAQMASRLYVYTLRTEKLKPFFEEIFERTGLCAVAFSALNGEFMRKAEVVFNLNKGGQIYDCFLKNSVYIDLADDFKNTERIEKSRDDMLVISAFEVCRGKRTIPPDYAEAAVSVMNKPFGEMIFNGFNFKRFDKSQSLLNQYGFDVISLSKGHNSQVKS